MDMIEKPQTALDVMKIVDNFLDGINTDYTSDREARRLWHLISSLRGPDSGEERLKEISTSLIRQKVVPNCSLLGAITVERDLANAAIDRIRYWNQWLNENDRTNLHFMVHAKNAFEDLGLKWDKQNG